ncbi:3'-5' exoribonuclease [Rhodococcoides fascians]|uniref:3'-5' exoribonuclease n=1 Tax=Rhodococcoides fascians TaxID=1828 RepID=UPI00056A35CD|nr:MULTISPECIES: 3'-5' exoribonuclease [Rhodococcus]OZE98103.1 hypothetical protein CH301_17320 [Rhodococcus sp. 15-1189-1-1a]OZF12753.1 hypothetical protein CH299_18005 [Rhodococcus sp. 14-2686-1-2]
MNKLVFLDTETISLRHDRVAWEIAMIAVEPDVDDPNLTHEFEIRMFVDGLDLSEADPASLRIGQFHDRHPRQNGLAVAGDFVISELEQFLGTARSENAPFFDLYTEEAAMHIVERWTRDATIVGAVPSFDMEVLANRMRWHGLCPMWHHRPICVETLVAGRIQWLPENRMQGMGKAAEQLGIEFDPASAHSAMGDTKLARRIFDEVFS